MTKHMRRLGLVGPLAVGATILVASCFNDASGPGKIFAGYFALAPSFQSDAADIVPVDRLRLTLRRVSDSSVALDTTVSIPPGADSVDLSFTVPLFAQTEQFVLRLALISPAGDTVFRAGPLVVTPTTSTSQVQPLKVPVVYTGAGAQAAGVRILTNDLPVFSGDTVILAGEAFDSNDVVIPGTPIAWSSLDTSRARVPDAAEGRVVGGALRGTASVIARLLTGPADTTGVRNQPRPSTAVIVSGNNQTDTVGSGLTNPIRIRVGATDGLGVSGVRVVFSVLSGGGTLAPDSALTNDSGLVQVSWTLGPLAGTQQMRARVRAAIADSLLTISATAQSLQPAVVLITPAGDTLTALGDTTRFSATADDAFGNPIPTATFTWTTSTGAIATVNPTGLVTAVGNGTAQIVATSGGVADTVQVLVAQQVASLAITPPLDTIRALGDTLQLTALAVDGRANPVTGAIIGWTSLATGIATVDG